MSAWKILFKSTFRSGTYSKTCVAALCTPENINAAMQQRDGNKRDDSTVLESLKALVPGDCHCLSVDAMNTALIIPWPFNQMVARGFLDLACDAVVCKMASVLCYTYRCIVAKVRAFRH